jgi:hypothetical protein
MRYGIIAGSALAATLAPVQAGVVATITPYLPDTATVWLPAYAARSQTGYRRGFAVITSSDFTGQMSGGADFSLWLVRTT